MRKIFGVLFLIPVFLQAQNDSIPNIRNYSYKEEIKLEYRPVSTIGLEILNIYDTYPALLLSYEYQWNDQMAVLQEGGPVVVPESYSGEEFIDYLGFKGRTEFKFYYEVDPIKNARNWIGLDFSYQYDMYEDNINIDHGNYIEFSQGEFTRYVLGTHVRAGTQRIFNDGKILLSASVGVGRSIYNVDKPNAEGQVTSSTGIREESPVDPFSMNVRLKLGYIIKKVKTVDEKNR